ncbi:MAG: hypothetical protein LBF67_08530, partial [Prevotellaceae bacterium]|nr:hypothetical protein [Prevotellaceae bacterium]
MILFAKKAEFSCCGEHTPRSALPESQDFHHRRSTTCGARTRPAPHCLKGRIFITAGQRPAERTPRAELPESHDFHH